MRDSDGNTRRVTYSDAGIDVDATDRVKKQIAASVDRPDPRVLNRLGAFASVVESRFAGFEDPVLVLKVEEPGSKQKLAVDFGRTDGLGRDLINHLVNDIAVVGAHPQYVLDCVVAGGLDASVIQRLVADMSEACADNGAVLVGGETSIQPRVINPADFVLSATVVGVAERTGILDGSRVQAGDSILAIASNGLHTNGYTLVRTLLDEEPARAQVPIHGRPLIDLLMVPHAAYYPALKSLLSNRDIHALAHITGGGLPDNVVRVLPSTVEAVIDGRKLRPQPIFSFIRQEAGLTDEEMYRTFNVGCGLVMICAANAEKVLSDHVRTGGLDCWKIGEVRAGSGAVQIEGSLRW